MRMKFGFVYCLLLLTGFSLTIQGQSPANLDPAVKISTPFTVEPSGFVLMRDIQMDWAATFKTIKEIHPPQPTGFKANWIEEKAKANRAALTAHPPAQRTTVIDPPQQGIHFEGQKPNGYPNDNDMAISNAGKIVSVSNSILYVYDQNGGNPLAVTSLSALGDAGGAGSFTKFDPKVIYDPLHDRFIVVFLSGIRSNSSQLVVCFSNSPDPLQGWTVYVFTGVTYPGTWSDFPQIGISRDELFITANQYTDALDYEGATLWQIGLDEGYNGAPLNARTLLSPYFSMHPVTGGDTLYGPHFYLVRTSTTVPNRTVSIHEMTNTLANGGVLNTPVNLQADFLYNVPPDANQPSSSTLLLTNDHRIQSAYLANGRIIWVGNTNFNGRPCIYYCTVSLSPFNILFSDAKGIYLQDPVYEMAYPAVTYAGYPGTSTNGSIIAFNYTSTTEFPGNGAILMSGDGTYSPVLPLKKGRGYLGTGTEATRRWGDYTGLKRKYDIAGEAWFAGSYGNITGGTDTWISQLNAEQSVSISPPYDETIEMIASPNPAVEWVRVQMEVKVGGTYALHLLDLQGRLVHLPIYNYLAPGVAEATFNIGHLANGMYFIVLQSETNREIFREKLVVQH